MENLLRETKEQLDFYQKQESDVLWVGGENSWFTWDEFKSIADFEYDCGYGGQEIAKDLIVVGVDWWLERVEYDGSEWWDFKTTPQKPEHHIKPKFLAGFQNDKCPWETLENIND